MSHSEQKSPNLSEVSEDILIDQIEEHIDKLIEDLTRIEGKLSPLPVVQPKRDKSGLAFWVTVLAGLVFLSYLSLRTEPTPETLSEGSQPSLERYVAPSTYSYQEPLPSLPRVYNLKENP